MITTNIKQLADSEIYVFLIGIIGILYIRYSFSVKWTILGTDLVAMTFWEKKIVSTSGFLAGTQKTLRF